MFWPQLSVFQCLFFSVSYRYTTHCLLTCEGGMGDDSLCVRSLHSNLFLTTATTVVALPLAALSFLSRMTTSFHHLSPARSRPLRFFTSQKSMLYRDRLKMVPRLRETRPAARGGQDVGITQSRDHSLANPRKQTRIVQRAVLARFEGFGDYKMRVACRT